MRLLQYNYSSMIITMFAIGFIAVVLNQVMTLVKTLVDFQGYLFKFYYIIVRHRFEK